MKNILYILLLFAFGCTEMCPDVSELEQREQKLINDSIRFDSIKKYWIVQWKVDKEASQKAWGDISEKLSKDSALVDTLMKLREQVRPVVNSHGNLTIRVENGVKATPYFDSITGKPKIDIK